MPDRSARDRAMRLLILLREVRAAKSDARDFALFDRRDALAALGVPTDEIENFDTHDDAALDRHIAECAALARALEGEKGPIFVETGDEETRVAAPQSMFGIDFSQAARGLTSSVTTFGAEIGKQTQDVARKAEDMWTRATTVKRPPPTPFEALPTTLPLGNLNRQLQKRRVWTEQTGFENGSTIVQRPWGSIDLIHNVHSADRTGAAADDLKNTYAIGFAHDHPRGDRMDPVTRQRQVGGSLSGGDMATLINAGGNILMAQDGDRQYAFVRTDKTPVFEADNKALESFYSQFAADRQKEGKSFREATDLAAREMAGRYGLGYYSGQNGNLHRQTVIYDPRYSTRTPKRP